MPRTVRDRLAAALVAVVLLPAGCAGDATGGLGSALDGLLGPTRLDRGTIVAGLREALEVGAANTVAATSQSGGFSEDPRIRIPLPESLEPMAKGLRRVGLGSRVDEVERAMNRAAERASAEALPVFLDAIRGLGFADARAILEGGETAATDFFRRATEDELRTRFAPIVEAETERVGLVRLYDELVARYTALPFATRPPVDLPDYVTQKGLDGLFLVLAEEERRIRSDPAARTSELLTRVFGT